MKEDFKDIIEKEEDFWERRKVDERELRKVELLEKIESNTKGIKVGLLFAFWVLCIILGMAIGKMVQ